ncbi:hypothetical protein [Mangrovihabitans endophyticus]|uniref:Uncharacterized protein n=1 Tax=Mangrovihabitans endophyticus TaxID=1751298 RepID=A0A8J3FPC9_9ACTN|nr:hypothetical protein [Mangrovihabitans endophyticus]GGK94102.1 hypothetical protein GCM10012284_30200 [Mangrovihabitans endophyticus]
MPIFRRCVDPDDHTVLVALCTQVDRPLSGDHLLLLTSRRLVVTQESRVLRRLRLYLNANLRHLSGVMWNPDVRSSTMEFAATAVDGVRERFRMRAVEPEHVWHVNTLLTQTFHGQRRSLPSAA